MERVKTTGEVARELGISVALIRKLENIGATGPVPRANRFRVYSPSDIQQLREVIETRRSQRRQTATA